MIKSWLRQHVLSSQQGSLPGVFAVACAIGLSTVGFWNPLEQVGYRILFWVREYTNVMPNPGWDDDIAVIAIDEASLSEYGRFPWPRVRYVELLNLLEFSQPAAIGLDILFVESTAADRALGNAIANNGNVILAFGNDSMGNDLTLAPDIAQAVEGFALLGHVHHTPDSDGISRQILFYAGNVPSLSIATLDMYQSVLRDTLSSDQPQLDTVAQQTAQTLRTLPDNGWVNWPGRISDSDEQSSPNRLSVYSYVDVLDGTVDISVFQNKIVLVGVTAAGIDPVRSPLNIDPPIAGVYLHAAMIDNLLNDRLLKRSPQWMTIMVWAGVGLVVNLVLNGRTSKQRLAIALCLPPTWIGISLIGFANHYWLPIAAPIGIIAMTFAGVQLREQRDKEQLMDLFAMHVAPETASLIWQRRKELLIDGFLEPQELTATVLFMDIRGFTSVAETLSSKDLVNWLNHYFEVMTDCIMVHGGVVDKYIGDAIMAVFGAPFPRLHHAEIAHDAAAAIHCAIEMHQRLQLLNQEFAANGQPTIRFGIGIHTGTVIAGSVGNRQRVNYSVFGDTVNIASRVEALTKELPPDIHFRLLMTEQTLSYVKDQFIVHPFQQTYLRGRQTETIVYQLESTLNEHPTKIAYRFESV
ncbi:MAG: adenylate/guanylate cyclase domain-containing protein [Cyanobacteria bacterium J06633_2]